MSSDFMLSGTLFQPVRSVLVLVGLITHRKCDIFLYC